ncbi:MAG: hypothetical protein EOO56_03685 [Hymenobacter sp.]|nr:MAG: hypothetical protein EOO56_03685 [Hymenobacter sp.]
MKKLFLLLPLLAGLLAACSATEAEDPAPAAPKHAVGWAVDGSTVTTEYWVSGGGGNQSWKIPGTVVVHVEGRSPGIGNPTAAVMLEVPPAVGTYLFAPASASWATYTAGGVKYYAGTAPGYSTGAVLGGGTITVTEYTASSIMGTFSFTAVDPVTGTTKTVVGGKFYVPI